MSGRGVQGSKPEVQEDVGHLQNRTSLRVTKHKGLAEGHLDRSSLVKPAGQAHLPTESATGPAGRGDILIGFQPGRDMVGLNLGRNILAAAVRMENEMGAGVGGVGRRTLGNSRERRCEMAEASFPWAEECRLRWCHPELTLAPREAQLGSRSGGRK